MDFPIPLSLEQLQVMPKDALTELKKSFDGVPEKTLPVYSRCLKGLVYERLGLVSEANKILLSLYHYHGEGVSLWLTINEFRNIYGSSLPNSRPKILTNITGGRVGLSLIANADAISFVAGSKLERLNASVISYNILKDSFLDILGQLPVWWKPDYALIFLTEADSLPAGLEKSPIPVVGLPGDPWKFYKAFYDITFFDAVMPAVECTCPTYRAIGNTKTFYTSNSGIQGFVPWQFANASPVQLKKEYDVVITGTLSNHFYRKRGQYVLRLLKLADRYKVFAGWVPTLEDCYDVMRRAKIVIHCASTQGGVNLRPFEAIACGALLLHGEGDRSIEEFFEPDKEVVLFNEENFEQKIEYYLHHDAEREQIVQRAMVKNRTHGNIVVLMKNTLDKIRQSRIAVTSRSACALADDEKLNALGISSFYAKDYQVAAFRFSEAIKLNERNAKYYNNLAVCLMVQAFTVKQRNPMIESLLLMANRINKPTVLSLFNLHLYYRFIQFNPKKFLEMSEKLAQDLQNNRVELPAFAGDELFFYPENSGDSMPEGYVFVLELESLLNAFPDRGCRYQEGFLKTLLWRILEYKADYYEKSGDESLAIREYGAALDICPRNEFILERVGKLCTVAGRFEEAELYLTRLLQLSPFHENAHLWLSRIEWDRGEKGKIKERISCLLHVTGLKNLEQFKRIMDKVV